MSKEPATSSRGYSPEHLAAWERHMTDEGVFAKEEIGFGCVTDSPREAVELILRGLPPRVLKRLPSAPQQDRGT